MIQLKRKEDGAPIGAITEQQLQFLIDQLEEESTEDRDYTLTPLVLDYFETHGGDPALVSLLRGALGGRDELVVQWSPA